jgi:hypothetical protein
MSDFNKQVGKTIDKAKAEKLKENWKKTKILTQSNFVGSDIIGQLLAKPGAVGLRIYYGMDDEGNMAPIFYACDSKGNAITSVTKDSESLDATKLDDGVDASIPCPPFCGGK